MSDSIDRPQTADESYGKGLFQTRRSFLDSLIGGVLGAGVIGAFYTAIRYLWPSKEIVGMSAGGTGPVNISLDELPVGAGKKIRYLGKPYFVVRDVKEFSVVSAVCTHLGCIVNWDTQIKKFTCPCHAAVFDIHGNVVSGPPPKPLPTAPFKIVENSIIVGA
jgi:cytochrome b6-f complex iron-sulfur subunit